MEGEEGEEEEEGATKDRQVPGSSAATMAACAIVANPDLLPSPIPPPLPLLQTPPPGAPHVVVVVVALVAFVRSGGWCGDAIASVTWRRFYKFLKGRARGTAAHGRRRMAWKEVREGAVIGHTGMVTPGVRSFMHEARTHVCIYV